MDEIAGCDHVAKRVDKNVIIANLQPLAKTRSILHHQWQPSSLTAQAIETAVQQLLA